MKFSEETLKQLENNRELIDSRDFVKIWKTLENPQLNEAFTRLRLNPMWGFTEIPSEYFKDTDVEKVEIPDNITSIGEDAFSGCRSLTSIEIPDCVTSIGDYAFFYCSSLVSVTIGNGVTSIGDGAFDGCSKLTSIEIPNGVTSIGERAFAYCPSLTSATIGNSVTSIGEYAFYGCTALESIVLPNSVTSIGSGAFQHCRSLTTIKFNGTKAQWESIEKGSDRKEGVPAKKVICNDGVYKY